MAIFLKILASSYFKIVPNLKFVSQKTARTPPRPFRHFLLLLPHHNHIYVFTILENLSWKLYGVIY